MVSRFFEVTRYNAIVTRYGRVTLPKKFLSGGRGTGRYQILAVRGFPIFSRYRAKYRDM